MTENSDPNSKVAGYIKRTTGEGGGRAGVAMVDVL